MGYERKIPDINLIEIIERGMKEELKSAVEDSLVNEFLSDLESKIRVLVKSELERFTLKGVEAFRDMRVIQEELNVYIKYNEEKPKKLDKENS